MNRNVAMCFALAAALSFGCAEMGSLGGVRYGETSSSGTTEVERHGTVTRIELVQVDDDHKLGIGTAVGAVAGAVLGHQIGSGRGTTVATVVGAAVGAAAGTVAESKMNKKEAQRVTVRMSTGGDVTILQPVDTRLRPNMSVRVEGGGESARVVPR